LFSSRNSFLSIAKWIADARKLAGADIALMLVGNKLDLEDREVSYLEASRFAQENGREGDYCCSLSYTVESLIGALVDFSHSLTHAPLFLGRNDIFGNKRIDRRRSGRDVSQVWARNTNQD
jgi:GTPase SAR1 family protein